MTEKPTYGELEKRIQELEKAEFERKIAADAMRESEERYRLLLEASDAGIMLLTEDGTFIIMNNRAAGIWGKKAEDLIGKHIRDLGGPPEFVDENLNIFNRVVKTGKSEQHERYIEPFDKHFIVDIQPVKDTTEMLVGIRIMIYDITERKRAEEALRESEEKFRSLAENSQDYIMRYDEQGRNLYQNEAGYRVSGFSEDEFLGKTHRELGFNEELCDLWEEGVQRVFKTSKPTGEIFQWESEEGPVSLDWRLFPEFDHDGQVKTVLGVSRDITDMRKAEEEKKTLESQLQQAQKMESIGTLVGGIAHDFNNILAAIIGFTELASSSLPESFPSRKYLSEVLKSGNRAKNLVQQLLTFSRPTDQDMKPIRLSSVVKETMSMVRATLPATIEIAQDIEVDRGSILADSTQIHQVLINLCTNAGYVLKESGGIIKVGLSKIDADSKMALQIPDLEAGEYLNLVVQDNGPGMEKTTLDRIFEPFFTTKGPGEGSGLGLSVVHGIVKSHGGAITVQSEPGLGTVFEIYLPLIQDAALTEAEDEITSLPRGDERVLFLDDEAMLAELGQSHLENLGYSVTSRTSSNEALELFKASPEDFDLIITDMTMPEMTGFDFAVEVMRIRPNFPIIICTGYHQQITEEIVTKRGIKGFLMKPYSASELAKIVRTVLDES